MRLSCAMMTSNMTRTLALLFLAAPLYALDPPPGFHLPDDVFPRKYTASLNIDPAMPAFEGSIQIEIELKTARTVIWLNAKELSVLHATIQTAGHSYPARATVIADEFLALEFATAIAPGPATLSLTYKAQLRQTPTSGAFRNNFENHWYAFTTFTAIDARRAFPCFDEPRFKTPWQLTLHIPRADTAYSNSDRLSETDEPQGMKAVRFAPTGLLASEVVAFAVGPFAVLPGASAGMKHVPVRIVTPAGHASEGADAAGMTDAIMSGLEQYTGIPYPWSKLDDVALPQGTFGGVEQPGMITYRMRALLSPADPVRLRSLLTHELAHQWFGNLVTQSAWQDVWLSEGFATWLTFHMTDPAHLSAIAARERIMAADEGPHTRPVRLEMHNRDEMKDIYSQFVYQKAGAILMMVEGWLGEDAFRDGLRTYLRAHSGGIAATDDLGQVLNATAVLHNFLDRSGVPVVRAELRCEANRPPALAVEIDHGPVPVCWKGEGIARRCAVFETGRHEQVLDRCPAWIYPNAGGTGYYRSEFDSHGLSDRLDQLTPAERLTFDYDRKAQEKK
jgi:alanyl aminopeptidase